MKAYTCHFDTLEKMKDVLLFSVSLSIIKCRQFLVVGLLKISEIFKRNKYMLSF